ncbi:NADPH2:quinone reductase [Saccharopolyspora erythraea NRRL 2338]|uniref:NAD(P)H-quinone oxidoreductase n=2 Tax=Saccharopolyspora erythraea TaxID=1836 RepID=A0ABN1D4P2_SACER|nr:NAD(P)H-quinone oxidoreductase [Saccharopolyspora erythraea]EQD88041.1 NAD(P)H quinone oxidoreductase [Saccharopolyspora erythraea D]PFG93357.1 NADPH2:quinone reductase [Saccharopolyspora erythraea NRRL 2338]QRK90195.1 NAD(P)H-quinone oxidoreductase [Saccharopolyspora erythraea]CAL99555.1 probable NADPH:quinone reductase [Saccharopolyspora erythraea NRRL 2338]
MYAIAIREPGDPDVLEWTEQPDPSPGAGEVLVKVAAAGVNRADLLQRRGFYPPPKGASEILGLECSGTIAELGEGVTGWTVGDQVCALLSGGGYAEQVAVPAAQVLPVPSGVDLVEAAGLPEVTCTVWSNVVMEAGLRGGQFLLVHGGSGGIGTCAIQVATALGARVAATAGSPETLQLCRELGADPAISYRDEDFVEVVKGLGGADVILDNMGASYLDRNISALAPDGHLAVIGMQGGRKAELDMGKMLAKRARMSLLALRSRPVEGANGKAAIVTDVRERLWPLVEEGKVRPIVHGRIPMREAARAHSALDAGGVRGKILLTVD